jgi:pyruvate, water dikinase
MLPSLQPDELKILASWGLQLEQHFKTPQDVEFVIDEAGQPWIVQSRALVLASSAPAKAKSKIKQEPLLTGGRTVYPGRSSGRAHLVSDTRDLASTPDGAVLFLRRATPEIVEVFPRITGLVAEWGNLTGHAAALLRESQIPSIFQMPGTFTKLQSGDPVSLDSVQPRVYAGTLWPAQRSLTLETLRDADKDSDPIAERLLTLHLTDPAASNFKPAGCRSAHDVLRFCHETAIGTMFEVGDFELERRAAQHSRKLATNLPVNLHVLDLGRGISSASTNGREVQPTEITSRPFQAFWRGVSSPQVTWKRDMPASLGDFASVMSNSLGSGYGSGRPLGEKSYLLVADEYMNLNSRLAYHFSLIDACLSAHPSDNYISFRFAGGGASRQRRNLRACFIEGCLAPYGFLVDRRGDLVNAWFKKAPAEKTEANLDILGRLMACSSQLDMYMTSEAAMKWYVRQFLAGNYTFRPEDEAKQEPALAH